MDKLNGPQFSRVEEGTKTLLKRLMDVRLMLPGEIHDAVPFVVHCISFCWYIYGFPDLFGPILAEWFALVSGCRCCMFVSNR
jgi:hypothetical protein